MNPVSESVVQLAASQPFFQGLGPELVEKIAALSAEVRFRAGAHLWRQGERHETCYLILQGQLALEIYVPLHGPLNVETIHAGELLGGSGLVSSHNWNFDARALTDVQAIAIDCTKLRQIAEEDHELGYQIYRALARILDARLTSARRRLLDLAVPSRG